MVSQHFARPVLAGLLGLAVAGGTAGLAVAVQGPTSAAGTTPSSAFAVSASGADPTSPVAAVSSAGAISHASVGSFRASAGTFTASGLSASAGAGTATASVADLVVGGQDLGSFHADCAQGVVTVHHAGSEGTGRVHVSPGGGGSGSGVAAVVTIRAIGVTDHAAETITVASVACQKVQSPPPSTGTTPPTSTGTRPPGRTPTTHPTVRHSPTSQANRPVGSTRPPLVPAPAPTPHPGQIAVTG